MAHPFYILEHAWPKITLPDPVIGSIGIQVATNWIAMESNKYDVPQRLRDNLQFNISIIILEYFFHIQNPISYNKTALPGWLPVYVIKLLQNSLGLGHSRA